MEKIGARTVLGFMLFLLSSCSCDTNIEHERLYNFKNSISDPSNSLSSWNLSVPNCHWNGISCNKFSRVTKIDISGKRLSGKIPDFISHFPFIETIDFSNNQFVGTIATSFSSSFSLRFLNLSNNNFTGQIPRGSNPFLQVLDLSNNMLLGEIPDEIGKHISLKYLDLGGNILVGKIPKSISYLTKLQSLTLASNQLIGEIPRELVNLKGLKWIYLGYNHFSGQIPYEIGELTYLNHLDFVNNNLTGEIPWSFGNLTDLRYLFLYLNKLTGQVPRSIYGLKKLISLDLSDNFLVGEIPELIVQLQSLEVLQLFSNNFSGNIPRAVSSLPRLQVLQLWENKFSGEIPQDLGKENNLSVLDLSSNSLTGKIPENLCFSGLLSKLILFSNSLKGRIPTSLGQCKTLKRIRLQNNQISGELVRGFTELPLVYFLDLSRNNLSGAISNKKWNMPELQMLNLAKNHFLGDLPGGFGGQKLQNLDLSENSFSGQIPRSFGDYSELMQLKLGKNKISGIIPDGLSFCKNLVSLDLSHNKLSGAIPSSLSDLPVLSQLDLSVNDLSGEVPSNLGGVESLIEVNISHNHFHGHLPTTGAFLAIKFSAVAGNNLCGGDSATGLPPCKGKKEPTWWLFLTCLFIVLAIIVLVIGFSVLFARQQKHSVVKTVTNEEGVWETQFFNPMFSKTITFDDILLSLTDDNLISRGNQGTTYKGKSRVGNAHFVTRKFNHMSFAASSGFWADLAKLEKLSHPNIAKVVATFRSEKDEVLIVYENTNGENLSFRTNDLNWKSRQKVAIDIAKALRYLHCNRLSGVFVADLSPENIIIDEQNKPHIRVRIMTTMDCKNTKGFVASAYLAPETKETMDFSEKRDIYAFGLILIQLLTGKTPSDLDPEFGLNENIIGWARYCYSDSHLDTWIDPTVKKLPEKNNFNGVVDTMNLALQCTAIDQKARPSASDLVKTLKSLKGPRAFVFGLKCSSNI